MSRSRVALPVGRILGPALALAIAGDLLLRASGGPGLNMALILAGVAGAILLVLPRERRWTAENLILIGIATACAAVIVLRDSPVLDASSFLAGSAALALIGLRGGAPWIARSGLSDVAEAIVAACAHAGLGALRLGSRVFVRPSEPKAVPDPDARSGIRRAGVGVRGVALALPFLFVFGALLVTADPVYAELLRRLIRVDVDPALDHLFTIGALTWLATGYLTGAWTGTRVTGVTNRRLPRSTIGAADAAVAIALIDVLFFSFVVVQVRYLFGGAEIVQITPGLTYAEYAREGAVQLAVCAALAFPALLLADWSVGPTGRGTAHGWLRALSAVLVLLLLVVLASAFQRLRVYQDAYGLTISRILVMAFLAWLAVVALVFVGTVLRGARDRFALLCLIAAVTTYGVVAASNPEAAVVRSQVARTEAQPAPAAGLDVDYLTHLGADAALPLLEALDRLSPVDRCRIADHLLANWGPDAPPADVRSWSLAAGRARRRVADAAPELRVLAQGGCA